MPQLSLFTPKPRPVQLAERFQASRIPRMSGMQEALPALPASLYLGTSSWSFPHWPIWKESYSEEELAQSGLAAYSRLFRTVGLDRTHYRMMSALELAELASQTPPDFRFLVKAPEELTLGWFPDHPRYGKRKNTANPRFLDTAYAQEVLGIFQEGLQNRLGVVLLQFAPQSNEHLGRNFIDALYNFCSGLPLKSKISLEIRNEKLLPAVAKVLKEAGVAPCVSVWSRLPKPLEQAKLLGVKDHPLHVARWMLKPGDSYDEAKERFGEFRQIQEPDPEIRAELCSLLSQPAREHYLIVNNKAEGCSPESIFKLAEALLAKPL